LKLNIAFFASIDAKTLMIKDKTNYYFFGTTVSGLRQSEHWQTFRDGIVGARARALVDVYVA